MKKRGVRAMNGDFGDTLLIDSLKTTLGRLELALDSVDEAIVWVDEEGHVTWCNNAFDRLVGRLRLQNLGQDICQLLPLYSENGPLSREGHPSRAVLSGLPRLTQQFLTGGEKPACLEIKASAVQGADGGQVVMVLRDVTESVRREAEAVRRTSYVAMLHEVAARANVSNDAGDVLRHTLGCVSRHAGWKFAQVWLPDARGDRLMVSDPVFSADSERFERIREVSLNMRFERGQGLPGRVLETGAPEWRSDVGLTPNGQTRISSVHGIRGAFAFPVLARGRVRAVLEFFSDEVMPADSVLLEIAREVGNQVTRVFERADADQALRDANDDLESRVMGRTAELGEALALLEAERETLRMRERAIDASTEGIVIFETTSALFPIHYVNAGYENMFGWSRDELLGQPASILLGLEPDPELYNRITGRMALGLPFTEVADIPRQNGEMLWVRASFTPIHDERGRVTAWLVVDSDLSRQKEVDQLKNELVSTVSHELRTPLGSMCGFAELLIAREHPPARQKQFLGIILEEGRRLGKLVDDFLDIQRIESGRQTYTFEQADLGALLQEAVAAFGGMPQVVFRLVPFEALAPVRLDTARIRQVMANLLSNAMKFSPEGGEVRVEVSARQGWVRVSVVDHGIGIPFEAQDRLFTRFFRVDNRDTRKIGGTGLGLALVKALVEAHSGQVGVESAPGKGSTFWFELPSGEPAEEFPDLFA